MFHAFTRPRYQVSVYRTIGPLVSFLRVFPSLIFKTTFFHNANILTCKSIKSLNVRLKCSAVYNLLNNTF